MAMHECGQRAFWGTRLFVCEETAVGAWGHAFQGEELAVEVCERGVAYGVGDEADGLGAAGEASAGFADAHVGEIAGDGFPGVF